MKKRWFLWVGAGINLLGLVILVISAFTSLFNPLIAGGGFLISIFGLALMRIWIYRMDREVKPSSGCGQG